MHLYLDNTFDIVLFFAIVGILSHVIFTLLGNIFEMILNSRKKKRKNSEYDKDKRYRVTIQSAEGAVISGFFVKFNEPDDEFDEPDLFFTDTHGKEHLIYVNGAFITSVDEI